MEKSRSHNFPNKSVSHFAKTSKDVKGKGKMVSEPKIPIKKSETNSKRDDKKFVKQQIHNKQKKTSLKDTDLKDNRIIVFQNTKKYKTTLIKRTYMVDVSITFPVSVKTSRGPKKLWVPKFA